MSPDGPMQRQQAYEAWKNRLAKQKAEQRSAFAPEPDPEPEPSGAGYWSAESLFRDSALEVEKERQARVEAAARQQRAAELLAVLGLSPGADLDAASARYKALALELHPDRQPPGSPDAGRVAERLVEASAAYGELKHLLA